MVEFCPECKNSIPPATSKNELEEARDMGHEDGYDQGLKDERKGIRKTVTEWRDEAEGLRFLAVREHAKNGAIRWIGFKEAYTRVLKLIDGEETP